MREQVFGIGRLVDPSLCCHVFGTAAIEDAGHVFMVSGLDEAWLRRMAAQNEEAGCCQPASRIADSATVDDQRARGA
jgi:hypothetical protein